MKRVEFVVDGEPQGKGRPRFSKAGGFTRTYTPKKTADYECRIRNAYTEQCEGYFFNEESNISLRIIAGFSIAKSKSKNIRQQMINKDLLPKKKPDADNIIKIVADALNGVAYKDDKQITECQIKKIYSIEPYIYVILEAY